MPTPTTIVVDQGNGQTAAVGAAFGSVIGVRLFDEFGNWMAGVSITFNAGGPFYPFPGGVFIGANPYIAITGGDGRAVSPQMVANDEVGAWSRPVFVTGTPSVTTLFSETNTPFGSTPTLTTLQFIAGAIQTVAQSTAYAPVSVRCLDQFGTAFPGGVITMTCPSGRGTFPSGFNAANAVADGSGVATFATYTASSTTGQFGPAITGSGANTLTADFTTVDATVVTNLIVYSGSNQAAPISTLFALPLVVRAVNGLGNPMAGVTVTFTLPGSPPTAVWTSPAVNPVTVATDVNGLATSPTFSADANLGNYYIIASRSLASSAFFLTTNGPAPTAVDTGALILCEV